jgi:ArsR family transcriptional regulator, arsenate/arsenite/antimonite-responsive transcriptional repressor
MAKPSGATGPACCPSLLDSPLDEPQADDLARAFAALADPVRLRLLSLIADAGEICACDLLEPLGKAQPTVSHHTKVLADVGLITGEKRGRWVWWSLVPDRVSGLRDALAPAKVAARA